MRIGLVKLLGILALATFGGTEGRADEKAIVEKELKKFHGTWKFEKVEASGKEVPISQFKGMTVIFAGDKYTVKNGDKVIQTATQKLNPSRLPKTLDVMVIAGPDKGAILLGIYEITGDTLKVCFVPQGQKRPTELKAVSDWQTLVIHKRVKK